jgi:hypothetical protein
MPAFRLLYTTPRTNHEHTEAIEWITDGSWDADKTRQAFHRCFPDAALIQCREIDPCPFGY